MRKVMVDPAAQITVFNCEREQIHIPGLIQTFGILICLDAVELIIEQISQNVEQVLGRSASSLLGQPLTSLIAVKEFEALKNELRLNLEGVPFRRLLDLKRADGASEGWIAFIHPRGRSLIVELEMAGKKQVPTPAGGLGFLSAVETSISEIQDASSLKKLCDIATREIQRITGFDRVMIYAFDRLWNGEVVAEARSGLGIDSFLKHRFPASDIPPQARAVFLENWVRMIPDVDYVPVPIVPTLNPKTGKSLDLGLSQLRSVSPIHIQYLKNMRVGSTVTISLIKEGQLWGLIACHHSSPLLLNYETRLACKFIGKLVSSQLGFKLKIEDTEEKERLRLVQAALKRSMTRESDLVRGLVNYSPNLLNLASTSEGSAAIKIGEDWTLVGKTPSVSEIDDLAEWLSERMGQSGEDVFYTDSLSEFFPAAASYKAIASGVIAVAIPKTSRSFIIWFMPEAVHTITWAGNPNKQVEVLPDGSLKMEPRLSFEGWKETVVGRSLPWNMTQVEAALELKNTVVGIDLGRQFVKEQEARAEAERISREKGDVLATVSHDLKNPLFAIDLAMQWFSRKHRSTDASRTLPQDVFRDVESVNSRIRVSTRRMRKLIDDLLDVAKIEGGTFALDLKMKDISTLIVEAVDHIAPLAQEKNITVESNCSDVSCQAMLDEDRVIQVLSNLVGNAIKFTPAGGKIVVSVKNIENELILSVRDSGSGISADHLPHVFDRFWQAAETSRMGTGLGLAICKGIVEAFGGRIWLESKLGEGTNVTFTIPLAGTSEAIEKMNTPVDKFIAPLVPMKILLVEDDDAIRGILSEFLIMEGHEVAEAVDGLAGKEILEKDGSFQLLITDFRMPRWDGAQLLEWCRSSQIHIPVIFITANVDLLPREKVALGDCCAALLRKPVSINVLLTAIADARLRSHLRDCG